MPIDLREVLLLFCFAGLTALSLGVPGLATGDDSGPALPPAPLVYAKPGTVITWELTENDQGPRAMTTEVLAPDGTMAMFSRSGEDPKGFYPACFGCAKNTVDVDGYMKLWPLAVGNSADFEHTRERDNHKYQHHVSVVRTETLTLPFGTVDTFVIDETIEGANQAWNAHTISWFAPSIGWNVRYESSDSDHKSRKMVATAVTPPS